MAPETTGHTNRHLNKIDSRYIHAIKNKVLETHDKAEHHINDIAWKLKSQNIHIGNVNIYRNICFYSNYKMESRAQATDDTLIEGFSFK